MQLERLIDERTFREQLTLFSVENDILQEHRFKYRWLSSQ